MNDCVQRAVRLAEQIQHAERQLSYELRGMRVPEGPSIVILKEEVQPFVGRIVTRASGTAALDFKRIKGAKVLAFRSWGKHFLIEFPSFAVRIHFLLFGSYAI